jgi:hypothetical protein
MTYTEYYSLNDYHYDDDETFYFNVADNQSNTKEVLLSAVSCYLFMYMMVFLTLMGILLTFYEERVVKLENKIIELEEEIDDLTPITFNENKTRDNDKWSMTD